MNKKNLLLRIGIIIDFFCAFIAWEITYFLRIFYLNQSFEFINYNILGKIHWIEFVGIPFCWVIFYYFMGYYNFIFQKNYIDELRKTIRVSLIGCFVIFLLIFLDDLNVNSKINFIYYYMALASYVLCHFILTYLGKIIFFNIIKNKKIQFSILIISDKIEPMDFLKNKKGREINLDGYNIVGAYSNKNTYDKNSYNGNLNNVVNTINEKQISIVIINLENKERKFLTECINLLASQKIQLKIIPDIIDIIAGNVKTNDVLGLDLIDVHLGLMPEWEQKLKRIIDIIVSSFALIIFSPLFIFLIIRVKMSSPGPVFYKQTRVGLKNTKFYIYKFRSMYIDAEKNNTPLLTQDNDNRITPFGRILRKWRLDEFPQFWNVLKGDMSIVGPRPEREFFINKLELEGIPFINLILRVKPGISSLGMVRYGYASNIQQMKDRLKYDLIYIENISILLDFKIILETFFIVIYGKGK